jgi:predicted dehydrogenase
MPKIVLLGAGSQSESVHGPSLAQYVQEHPGEIELAAVCDLREERARLFCGTFGFARSYTDLDQMLDTERPDACWVVSPIDLTRELAGRVMQRGIPTFFEKPPGRNVKEARELAEIAERAGTPNMVAFNRRWAPCTRKALAWAKDNGPFEYIYARMLRTRRAEQGFAIGTGIHLLDCVRALAESTMGGIRAARTTRTEPRAGVFNFHTDLDLGSGAHGRCDILPTCGVMEESYTLFGRDRSILSSLPWVSVDGKAELSIGGDIVDSESWPARPSHMTSGFYGETVEFISALREGRRPSPSPQESVDSVALAEAVQEGRAIGF